MVTKQVGNFKVSAKSNRDATRLYFVEVTQRNPARAVWNLIKQEWMPTKGEFGWRQKAMIKKVFNL